MGIFENIILLIGCIFEIYIFYDFFRSYFEYNINFEDGWKRVLISAAAVGMIFTANVQGNSYINLITSLTVTWLYFTLLFTTDTGTRIVFYSMVVMVGWGCEFLFSILINMPSYIERRSGTADFMEIPWYIFAMKLLTYIMFAVIKQFYGNSKRPIKSNRVFAYYMCIPVACLGIMLLTYYSGIVNNMPDYSKILLSISFMLMLVGNIFIFNAFNRYAEELYKNAEQSLLITRQQMDISYYERIKEGDERHREFIHNISHHLRTIGELAREGNTESIVSVLTDLDIELENSAETTTYSNNPVLNAVLTEKQAQAEKAGAEMDIYVEPGTNLKRVSDADLITMLGNLLDNAVRAAKEATERKITVRIFTENDGSFNIVKIRNHYSGELKEEDGVYHTTKKDKGLHGIGLKSIGNTAEKYGGYLECFAEEGKFTAVLIISGK